MPLFEPSQPKINSLVSQKACFSAFRSAFYKLGFRIPELISLSTNSLVLLSQLVAVVVSFFLCWAPFHIQRMFAILVGQEPTDPQVNLYNLLTNISGVTYYLSATINPILYSIMSLKFRTAFKETLHQVVLSIRWTSPHLLTISFSFRRSGA